MDNTERINELQTKNAILLHNNGVAMSSLIKIVNAIEDIKNLTIHDGDSDEVIKAKMIDFITQSLNTLAEDADDAGDAETIDFMRTQLGNITKS